MTEELDHSEEIARLEARLAAWEARNGKLYEGLQVKDANELKEAKQRIYSEHIRELQEIQNRLKELQQTPPRKDFYEGHPYLYLLGFALAIVGFFVALNLILPQEPSPPTLSDSERQERCLASIPTNYPETMYDNAVENCLMIGSND